MDKNKVVDHIMRNSHEDIRGVFALLANKLRSPAITLMYAAMDRMSWLDASREESGNPEFKEWVNKYLLAGETFSFTADDLWAARCGMVHTGAAESRDFRANRANAIYYYTHQGEVTEAQLLTIATPIAAHLGIPVPKVKLVDYYWLAERLVEATERFDQHLRASDEQTLRPILDKANRQLSFQPLE
ncbi:hypothetical protein [Pseudomonas rhodesiae]|uniref:hypothetical protein n=1 Tax=Pseudomonas rhodesiae TaxID=76760 RepID=UPI0032B1E082